MQNNNIATRETPTGAMPANELSATTPGENDMSAQEERRMILRMVEEGKISPEEGAKLLAAVGESSDTPPAGPKDSFDDSRVLRIRVSDLVTGQEKVNVNVPVGFVRFGLRFIPESANIDVQAILDALDSGMRGRIVDVTADDDGKRVEVFFE
ncbi:MAG: SHOCT-like domain-containing protein [Caldilineaceae bacterium]